jgi:hypothetical protein
VDCRCPTGGGDARQHAQKMWACGKAGATAKRQAVHTKGLIVPTIASLLLWSVIALTQQQESIGQVTARQGQATVQHAGSTQAVPLNSQHPVYREDIIQWWGTTGLLPPTSFSLRHASGAYCGRPSNTICIPPWWSKCHSIPNSSPWGERSANEPCSSQTFEASAPSRNISFRRF